MDNTLTFINNTIYQRCDLNLTDYKLEAEGHDYEAFRFKLNNLLIIGRTAKITPKKIGQFVTCWKRNDQGITEPFSESDEIDFYSITVKKDNRMGQFVIPKSALIQHKIISTKRTDGKRGFRVYPKWDHPTSNQAIKTQAWQLKYFYEIDDSMDLQKVSNLF